MDDIEAIRQRKLAELQQGMSEQAQLGAEIARLESMVKARMTKDAAERYHNIKAANPQQAVSVLLLLSQALQRGDAVIDDIKFKGFLEKVIPRRREFRMTRK
jgi:DNA-binding TFAR19-related protein (PDSD5 family)